LSNDFILSKSDEIGSPFPIIAYSSLDFFLTEFLYNNPFSLPYTPAATIDGEDSL